MSLLSSLIRPESGVRRRHPALQGRTSSPNGPVFAQLCLWSAVTNGKSALNCGSTRGLALTAYRSGVGLDAIQVVDQISPNGGLGFNETQPTASATSNGNQHPLVVMNLNNIPGYMLLYFF